MSTQRPAHLAWLDALRDPALAGGWALPQWEDAIRMARRQRLLARWAAAVRHAGLIEAVPPEARRHLLAEERLSAWRKNAMCWALERIGEVLADSDMPLVLLKGAAYVGQQLPIAEGRMPSDVDILVPQSRIAEAQSRLVEAGWNELPLDEHDRRYYHAWSHEVPPMQHPSHHVELDLHHNILPPVSTTRVDAARLLAQLRPSRWPRWQVLHPVDQVLHSAAHLFLDAEARDRIRDLVDLDGLMRHFAAVEPGFWPALPLRSQELGLQEPLALAVHFCMRWIGTPIPEAVVAEIRAAGPGAVRRHVVIAMLQEVLMPSAVDLQPGWTQSAAAAGFLLRYHGNRLPLRLLVPHLWHKLNRHAERTTAQN